MAFTLNGAQSNSTTGNARVDLFYAACRGLDETRLATLMRNSYNEDPLDTLKIVAYVRDIRGGKGERKLGRQMYSWLANNEPETLKNNFIHYISVYGRFDDALALMETDLEYLAINLWSNTLILDNSAETPSLAAKWIPSEGKAADKKYHITKKLVKTMMLSSSKVLRQKYIVPLRRKLEILETKMCASDWESIDLNHVPSCAMKIHGRPCKAFPRNLGEKFNLYKEGLAIGTTKVNAKDLYPHEIVKQ
jgi:hypothetical protein